MTDIAIPNAIIASIVSATVTVILFSLKEWMIYRREKKAAHGMLRHFAVSLSSALSTPSSAFPHLKLELLNPHLSALVSDDQKLVALQEVQDIHAKWTSGSYMALDPASSQAALSRERDRLRAIAGPNWVQGRNP
jgi:hypothetical protein